MTGLAHLGIFETAQVLSTGGVFDGVLFPLKGFAVTFVLSIFASLSSDDWQVKT